MRLPSKVIIAALILVLLVSGCGPSGVQQAESGEPAAASDNAPHKPVAGKTITISNCRADPLILQVRVGDVITLKNLDDQNHVIFIDNKEIQLPAKGSAEIVAIASLPVPFTNNFACDQEYGGAIYIES